MREYRNPVLMSFDIAGLMGARIRMTMGNPAGRWRYVSLAVACRNGRDWMLLQPGGTCRVPDGATRTLGLTFKTDQDAPAFLGRLANTLRVALDSPETYVDVVIDRMRGWRHTTATASADDRGWKPAFWYGDVPSDPDWVDRESARLGSGRIVPVRCWETIPLSGNADGVLNQMMEVHFERAAAKAVLVAAEAALEAILLAK